MEHGVIASKVSTPFASLGQASQYGYTDTGPKNIAAFFSKHKCNQLCRHLDLKPITGDSLPDPTGPSAPGTHVCR